MWVDDCTLAIVSHRRNEDQSMAKSKSGGGFRNAKTGRYVTPGHAGRNPSTTVKEAPGPSGSSGARYRSAISGRYVTTKYGKASPHTTVREK